MSSPTLVRILRPVIRVNQIIGICPHEIEDDIMIFRWTSSNFCRTILTLVILTLYFFYILFQFFSSFSEGKKLDVVELVNLAMWANGTLIPIAMLCVTIKKRNQFTKFFQKIGLYKVPLRGILDCQRTLRYSRKLYALYIFFTLMSIIFVASDTIRKPRSDFSLLFYVPDPSMTLIIFNTIWQCYLVLIKSGASAFIEVLCCSLAGSFVHSLRKIQKEMRETMERRESDIYLNKRAQRNNIMVPISKSTNQELDYCTPTDELDLENEVMRNNMTYGGYDLYSHHPQSPYRKKLAAQESSEFEGALPLLRAVKRFHCVASMQRLMNCIFGQILALNTALLVFMSCFLLFLQIRYLGLGNVDTYDGLIFSGRTLIFFARLIIVFLNLGNLHEAGTCFNGALSQSLIQVKKPKPAEINMIVAHLTTNIANPICYSAGGFFIFSRSSLLAVFSIITTYLVFLLQAGSDDKNSVFSSIPSNCTCP